MDKLSNPNMKYGLGMTLATKVIPCAKFWFSAFGGFGPGEGQRFMIPKDDGYGPYNIALHYRACVYESIAGPVFRFYKSIHKLIGPL